MKNQFIVVLVTAKNSLEAKKIARGLLKDQLIACANIVPGIESMYSWKGKIETGKEVLMVIKTKQSCFEQIVTKVKLLHSYQTPEIIALPVVAGSWNYLKWIDETLLKDK